jgi:hypothetical protein
MRSVPELQVEQDLTISRAIVDLFSDPFLRGQRRLPAPGQRQQRSQQFLIKITRMHYELWTAELMPVFLILYDAGEQKAYWLYIQEYFGSDPSRTRRPHPRVQALTLRIPVANQFTGATVEYICETKARILAQIAGKIRHDS